VNTVNRLANCAVLSFLGHVCRRAKTDFHQSSLRYDVRTRPGYGSRHGRIPALGRAGSGRKFGIECAAVRINHVPLAHRFIEFVNHWPVNVCVMARAIACRRSPAQQRCRHFRATSLSFWNPNIISDLCCGGRRLSGTSSTITAPGATTRVSALHARVRTPQWIQRFATVPAKLSGIGHFSGSATLRSYGLLPVGIGRTPTLRRVQHEGRA